jgi:hypothetical protein
MNAMPFRIEYRVQFDTHDYEPDEHWRDNAAADDNLVDARERLRVSALNNGMIACRIVERVIFEKVIVS